MLPSLANLPVIDVAAKRGRGERLDSFINEYVLNVGSFAEAKKVSLKDGAKRVEFTATNPRTTDTGRFFFDAVENKFALSEFEGGDCDVEVDLRVNETNPDIQRSVYIRMLYPYTDCDITATQKGDFVLMVVDAVAHLLQKPKVELQDASSVADETSCEALGYIDGLTCALRVKRGFGYYEKRGFFTFDEKDAEKAKLQQTLELEWTETAVTTPLQGLYDALQPLVFKAGNEVLNTPEALARLSRSVAKLSDACVSENGDAAYDKSIRELVAEGMSLLYCDQNNLCQGILSMRRQKPLAHLCKHIYRYADGQPYHLECRLGDDGKPVVHEKPVHIDFDVTQVKQTWDFGERPPELIRTVSM